MCERLLLCIIYYDNIQYDMNPIEGLCWTVFIYDKKTEKSKLIIDSISCRQENGPL